jgi:hypothetical protein
MVGQTEESARGLAGRGARVVLLSAWAILILGCASSSPVSGPATSSAVTSGPGTPAQTASTPTAAVTPSPTPSPPEVSDATAQFATASGDAVTVTVQFGPPLSYTAESQSIQAAAAQCYGDSRAVLVRADLVTTITSDLPADIQLLLPTPVEGVGSDPQVMYEWGGATECGRDEPAVTYSGVRPHSPTTLTLYLIYTDAITPDQPTPDPSQIGSELITVPYPESVELEEPTLVDEYGGSVLSCDDETRLLPAGLPPASCTPELTPQPASAQP